MRKAFLVSSVLGLVALGAAACSSSSTPSAAADKASFCSADVHLDKAGADVTSLSGFLTVLKDNTHSLDTLDNDAPGSLRKQVHTLVAAARTAVKSGDTSALQNPSLDSVGASVDTYCGVDGDGARLPAYFAAGKGSPFCSVSNSINTGTENATSAAQILAFLSAHQTLITQYSSYVSGLPASVRSYAQTLVTTAQSAIASKDASALGSSTVSTASGDMQLYCGQNS